MTNQTTAEWRVAPIGQNTETGEILTVSERAQLAYLQREVATLQAELEEARKGAANLQLELEREKLQKTQVGYSLPKDAAAATIEQLLRELAIEQQQTNYWYIKANHTEDEVKAMQQRRQATLNTFAHWLTPADHASYAIIDDGALEALPHVDHAA